MFTPDELLNLVEESNIPEEEKLNILKSKISKLIINNIKNGVNDKEVAKIYYKEYDKIICLFEIHGYCQVSLYQFDYIKVENAEKIENDLEKELLEKGFASAFIRYHSNLQEYSATIEYKLLMFINEAKYKELLESDPSISDESKTYQFLVNGDKYPITEIKQLIDQYIKKEISQYRVKTLI